MHTLNLKRFSGRTKFYAAIKFLPVAFNLIASRKLIPVCTFHIYNKDEIAVGISDGYIYYPTELRMMDDIAKTIILLEDRRFYAHRGVDLKALIRAFIRNMQALKVVEGGSTITQQLVRNSLITPDRSLIRKFLELLLALKIERHYSKEEILNLYIQFVYLGNGIRGFSAASKALYRHSLRTVTHEEGYGLIALIRKPSTTYPTINSHNFRKRQQFIAKRVGCDKPHAEPPGNKTLLDLHPIEISKFKKPRWSTIIENLTEENFGDIRHNIRRVGITIDSTVQNILDAALKQASLENNISQIAAVVLDNKTCRVLGESAWSNGVETCFSPTFAGKIQPGSTFKTFAFLTALEFGLTSGQKLLSSPFKSDLIKNHKGQPWTVRNYGDIYRGEISLSSALEHSDNTAFARLSELIDIRFFLATYQKYHLCKKNEITPAIVLGALIGGTSLLSLAAAYAAIARNGTYIRPRFLRYVEDYNGHLNWTPCCSEGFSVTDNYWNIEQVKKALRDAGGHLCNVGFSGKTGTTKDGSLFAGYNDKISLAIWTGFKVTPQEGDSKTLSSKKILLRIIEGALGYNSKLFTI